MYRNYRTIVEENPANIAVIDVMSKLVQERIIFIDGPIDDVMANNVISQMIYLDYISKNPIKIYINSPGGQITQGLAIYDVAKSIKSPIITIGIGQVASMGCILMFCGDERKSLEHTRFLLHQPSSGAGGTFKELTIHLNEVEILKEQIYSIIKQYTTIKEPDELLLFDKWFGAEEALSLGVITQII